VFNLTKDGDGDGDGDGVHTRIAFDIITLLPLHLLSSSLFYIFLCCCKCEGPGLMLFSSNILQSGLKGVFGSDLCLFEIIGDIFF
jgi:hypothetical protein